MDELQYEDFAKLDIRIGTVVAAELVPDTDKLIKCTVDFGDPPAGGGTRTIVSGIARWPAGGGSASGGKKPEELIGKQLPYIVNLAPRVLRGVESQGMLLAASDESGVALIFPERAVQSGTRLK
ncbi:MAG TPA: hypothetical protein VJG64_03725 [Candidatus Paceibacterota bacterium]